MLASAVRRNLFVAPQLAFWLVITLMLLSVPTQAQATHDLESSNITKISDVSYAQVDGYELKLDIYMPVSVKKGALVIYIHGGAWRGGSKEELPTEAFIQYGYAIATIEFRMSSVPMFPAQIYDIKAALRYLRGNAEECGFDASKIGIYGTSSGRYLVSTVAVSSGDQGPQMPINQSRELHHAYQQQGVEVQFEVVHGAGQGSPHFVTDKNNAIVKEFVDRHLL